MFASLSKQQLAEMLNTQIAQSWFPNVWGKGYGTKGLGKGKGFGKGGKGDGKGDGKGFWKGGATANKGSKGGKGGNGEACVCCGKTNRQTIVCRHREKECNLCGMTGHLEVMCRSKQAADGGAGGAVATASDAAKTPDTSNAAQEK